MKKYMIIDARGNYWCENGEPYEYCDAVLANILESGETKPEYEPEIVEIEED